MPFSRISTQHRVYREGAIDEWLRGREAVIEG
jgi:hypothetical protein